jgi:hypothetical protein
LSQDERVENFSKIRKGSEILLLEFDNLLNWSLDNQDKIIMNSRTGKISTVGDTFQLNLVMNANNSYTASGQYRVVSTITNNGEEPTEESEIVVIDASGGSYQLNSNNTITFNPQDDEFFEGVFIIETFNETSIILSQKDIEVDGNTTFTVEAAAGFIRE